MGFWSRLFGGGGAGSGQVDYSVRTDDELRHLAGVRADLTEAAQRALDEELARRGLSLVEATHAPAGDFTGAVGELEALLVTREDDVPETPEARQAWELIHEALSLLHEQQDYAAVIDRCERAIQLVRNAPADQAFIAGTAHQMIAQTFINRERWEDAQGSLERAIALLERDEGSAQETTTFEGELARVLVLRGLNEEAEGRLRRAVDRARRLLPGEPLLAHLLEELAALVRKRGLETDAAALEREAHEIHEALIEAEKRS